MYIFDEVVAVGFNTLRYGASVGGLNRTNKSKQLHYCVAL